MKSEQNELDFAKNVIFLGITEENRISRACKELKHLKNSDKIFDFDSAAAIRNDKDIKLVANKYGLKFNVLKSIFYGTKLN